ncbi:LuxE/PaaK family acyltransferase [Chitinophagaceae bacterium MMS25-I14]
MTYSFDPAAPGYIQCINAENFDEIALALFRFQYETNQLYREFTDALHILPEQVNKLQDIPFLPISFFKTYKVQSGNWQEPALVFESSGTTGDIPSRHFIHDATIYEDALMHGFNQFYGAPEDYAILALLPSYLERGNASLVHMAKVLMEKSGHPDCGFYLDEWEKLAGVLQRLEKQGQKVLLLGVTFALLDFAATYPMSLQHTVVMETGGMKGRRAEWTREQVHTFLKAQWGIQQVHSEYGMTELLSQAYAAERGIFHTTSTMKVMVRDINDPLDVNMSGTGCLNIIDLANVYSCAFIAAEDVAKLSADGSFEVLGRVDHAALRGCNLMVL